ncbi:MAG: NUDIX domain-containing protein [Parcubacteria group bacterium]|jgi:mutator protein MutT
MFTIGAFGVIFDENNRVLLCHRRDMNLWNLPGGMVERGKSPWEGVVREVREEVGLDVEVIRLIGVYSKKKKNDVIFSFVCKKVGGVETLTDEADEIAYFAVENLPANLSPKHVERIGDAIQEKREVVMKIQSDQSGRELLAKI